MDINVLVIEKIQKWNKLQCGNSDLTFENRATEINYLCYHRFTTVKMSEKIH